MCTRTTGIGIIQGSSPTPVMALALRLPHQVPSLDEGEGTICSVCSAGPEGEAASAVQQPLPASTRPGPGGRLSGRVGRAASIPNNRSDLLGLGMMNHVASTSNLTKRAVWQFGCKWACLFVEGNHLIIWVGNDRDRHG